MDNLYQIRRQLEIIVKSAVSAAMQKYVQAAGGKIEYFLHYPLITIEMGTVDDLPQSMENGARRETFSFLVQQTTAYRNSLNPSTDITNSDFDIFTTQCYPQLRKIYNDYRTLLEIQDASSYAKSIIEQLAENAYQFKTSLVCNTYREEDFYFYGLDNPGEFQQNRDFIDENIHYLCMEYGLKAPQKIKRLPIDIDSKLLAYANAQVERDLSNLPNKIKSEVISSRNALINVIGFLYYLGVTKRMYYLTCPLQERVKNCLIDVDKAWLINKICKVTSIPTEQVEKIINYLINDGKEHILEFPLFEHTGHIITAPSLLVVNDWQFSIVNGHYYKNIDFIKRDKTISKSTQEKLKALLINASNIVYREEKYYEFEDDGRKANSDIDFALYDRSTNTMMVIEAKWKNNHYSFIDQKRYKKIEDTFSTAYNEQISKHTKYLQQLDNPLRIFDEYSESPLEELPLPKIWYLVVDKRNQLHLNNKHMITEFMLLAFLRAAQEGDNINLENVVQRIFDLKTTVEYISSPPLKAISLEEGCSIYVDEYEFQLEYS